MRALIRVVLAALAGLCVVMWACVYPEINLNRYDLSGEAGEGEFVVRFSFLIEGAPDSQAEAGASAMAAGSPSRSVLPGLYTPAVYKISARLQSDVSAPWQTAYITPSGTAIAGSISIPAVTALRVNVDAYSVWDGTSEPDAADLILQKNGITFSEAEVASGVLQITLNPLTDKAPDATGSISLNLAWPYDLDFDSDMTGNQGITKISANLLDMNGAEIQNFTGAQDITTFITTSNPYTALVGYTGVPAGSYKLRLTFFRGVGGNLVIGYFTEVVTVWPGGTANSWIDGAGVSHNWRLFTQDEFYDAAASVAEITVKMGTTTLPVVSTGGTTNVVKAAVHVGENVEFTIKFDADGAGISGKSLDSVNYFINAGSGTDCTGEFSYIYEGGSYISRGDFSMSGTPTLFRVEIVIKAPDRVTTKTYAYTFATAMLDGTTPTYYYTVKQAVDAATGGSAGSPKEVVVLANAGLTDANLTIGPGKYVKLRSEAGAQRVIKRAATWNTGSLITVNGGGELTLENIIVDGGAVWAGTPPAGETLPSPAFSAVNTGGINAAASLVTVSGSGTKLTLGAGAVLRNNCTSSAGGGIRADTGAEVRIDGGEVCYNQSGYTGGGIVLQDGSQRNTKLTLISGSINNNKSAPNDGGGINAEYGNIDIQGGFITKNHATTNGGGINVNASGASTMTISGGEISDNVAVGRGGGIKAGRNYTVTMSGGVISGNTAGTTGNGVHVGGAAETDDCAAFIMLNGARIAANNDIYLSTGETITVNGNLTEAAPVATITPPAYVSGTQVLIGTVVSANYQKFAVTPGTDTYTILNSGLLIGGSSGGEASFLQESG
ncbi:MAG: autotransporter adhesin family protein, partial [Spirochaetaceae bacterium]|nr:autotransporter adhesin family protein [Spirochaetaceae bacterium]